VFIPFDKVLTQGVGGQEVLEEDKEVRSYSVREGGGGGGEGEGEGRGEGGEGREVVVVSVLDESCPLI
jgi:hypothetical protein